MTIYDIILIYTKHRLTQQLKRCFCNMQGNHIQSTPCVFSLQPALCAWKYHIWPSRGIPRTRFSNFPSFGPPEALLFPFFARRLQAKRCFSHFLHFAHERRAVFSVFRSSLMSDEWFSAFSVFPLRGKVSSRCYFVFPRRGKPFFEVFLFSPMRESSFSLNFDFPPWGKANFSCFLFIRDLGRLSFPIFC